jgi:hypothetical protein
MRVEDLDGAQLDYWVHRALLLGGHVEANEGAMPIPNYSTDWIAAERALEIEDPNLLRRRCQWWSLQGMEGKYQDSPHRTDIVDCEYAVHRGFEIRR